MQKITKKISKTSKESDSKTIARINLKVKASNFQGTLKITDIMLQTGSNSTLWNGHPSEVRWSFGE